MWLKVGVGKRVGVVMITPTFPALESKPVKASISAFSENIQDLSYLTELSCNCCVQEEEI